MNATRKKAAMRDSVNRRKRCQLKSERIPATDKRRRIGQLYRISYFIEKFKTFKCMDIGPSWS